VLMRVAGRGVVMATNYMSQTVVAKAASSSLVEVSRLEKEEEGENIFTSCSGSCSCSCSSSSSKVVVVTTSSVQRLLSEQLKSLMIVVWMMVSSDWSFHC